MKSAECSLGRVFLLRLEDGDRIPDCIENFASENGLSRGTVFFLGGIGKGKLIVGPSFTDEGKVVPMVHSIEGVHEALAVGTLFPDEGGKVSLHMHSALGREGKTSTGCVRAGVEVWMIGEVVIYELVETGAKRKKDPETGFELLAIE
ncbi:DNA-binding protein [bacterium]|nr:MAG: DNA-binding protein [bacterium]